MRLTSCRKDPRLLLLPASLLSLRTSKKKKKKHTSLPCSQMHAQGLFEMQKQSGIHTEWSHHPLLRVITLICHAIEKRRYSRLTAC